MSSVDRVGSSAVSAVDKLGSSAVSFVDERMSSAVSSVDKIGSSTICTVLHSVGESVWHVSAIPYVFGIVLVVISCVQRNVPARKI